MNTCIQQYQSQLHHNRTAKQLEKTHRTQETETLKQFLNFFIDHSFQEEDELELLIL